MLRQFSFINSSLLSAAALSTGVAAVGRLASSYICRDHFDVDMK